MIPLSRISNWKSSIVTDSVSAGDPTTLFLSCSCSSCFDKYQVSIHPDPATDHQVMRCSYLVQFDRLSAMNSSVAIPSCLINFLSHHPAKPKPAPCAPPTWDHRARSCFHQTQRHPRNTPASSISRLPTRDTTPHNPRHKPCTHPRSCLRHVHAM